jgi:hypothetical protein
MSKKSEAVKDRADQSSRTGVWFTPRKVLDCVDAYFGGKIPFDPYTSGDNPTNARKFATIEADGNRTSWAIHGGVFCNPPYGAKNGLNACLDKIALEASEGTEIICLVSATRFETGRGQECILNDNMNMICFPKGRVKFLDEHGTPHNRNTQPSVIYGYNARPGAFKEAFGELGRVMQIAW